MVPSLSSKYAKEESKGLVIIGVTDEDPAIVEKWLSKMKTKPSYPIAILKDRKLEQALGVKAFPTQGVVDPSGVLTFAGHGGESELSKALDSATKGGIWPKKLEKAAGLLRTDEQAKAHAELKTLLATELDDKEKTTAERFVAYLEGVGKSALAAGRTFAKEGRVLDARKAIEKLAAAEPALPATADAKALQAELEALPSYKLEISGGELFAEADALEEDYEFLDAISGYKAVVKKAPGTKIAAAAEERMKGIVDKGMPGFSKNCGKCRDAGKACPKHAKPVKL